MRACDTCIHVRVRARKHTQGIQVGDEVSLHALKSEQYNGLNGIVLSGLSFEGVQGVPVLLCSIGSVGSLLKVSLGCSGDTCRFNMLL